MELIPFEGKQLQAASPPDGCTVIAFEGAVRSSKTIVSLLMWVQFIRHHPTGNLAMFGKTIDTVIRNLLEPMQGIFGAKRVTWNRGLGTAEILGRTVYIMGANDEKARTKVQGLTLLGAYVDEVANVPESFFNMLRSRLSAPGARMFLTCNPEGPKHWFLVKWLRRARWWVRKDGTLETRAEDRVPVEVEPGKVEQLKVLPWYRVTFTLADNVWLNRTNPEFVEEIRASYSGVFYRRNIDSEWVSADGMVYPEFDGISSEGKLGRHVIPAGTPLDVRRVFICGVDYGTNHRTRGYLLGHAVIAHDQAGQPVWAPTGPADGYSWRDCLVALEEFAPDTATVGQHANAFEVWLEEAVSRWGEPDWIAVDPAAATFKAELFARGRSDVINAHNAVLSGIQYVASLFAAGRLYLRQECGALIAGLPGYMWDTKATERGATAPVKENDDEADALRYAVYTSRRDWRGLIPIALPLESDDTEEEAA